MIRLTSRRAATAVVSVLLPVALAACGTRVSRAEVVAAAGGGPVTLNPGEPSTDAGAPVASVPTTGPTVPTTGAGSGVEAPSTTTATSAAPVIASAGGGAGGPITPTNGPSAGPPSTAGAGPTATRAVTAKPATGQPCTKQGSPIIFGQLGTFSGIIGASQGSAQPGLKVWAAATNAAGGIACHPVQVISIDDAGDAGKAQSAVQQLVETDRAVAINAFVPVTINGIQPYIDAHKIPVVGGDLLSTQWTADPNLFPQGSAFESVIYSFLKYGAMEGGHKYSFFYCIEATPCTAAQDFVTKKGLAAKAGLTGVGDQPISLAGSNFTQQCSTAKSKGADVVIIGAGATAASAIGRDCSNQNYHPIYITEALAAITSLQDNPGLAGLAIGNTVFPWMLGTTPAEAAYQAALAKYAPGLDNGGGAANAWTSGELLKAAILKLGDAAYGDLTPALIAQGLHLLKGETLGGLAPGGLTYPAGQPATPVRCAFIAAITNGKWGAPIGNQQICEP